MIGPAVFLWHGCAYFVVMVLGLLPCFVGTAAASEETSVLKPDAHWSVSVQMGWLRPAVNQWEAYYGDDKARLFSLSFGFRLTPVLEFGVDAAHWSDRGVGELPANRRLGGAVLHEQAAIGVYGLVRGIFHRDQRLVPYAGGGYTQVLYQQKLFESEQRRGRTDGVYVKAGVQFLLDPFDRLHASYSRMRWGIDHTYLALEGHWLEAEMDDVTGAKVDLGGRRLTLGITIEY